MLHLVRLARIARASSSDRVHAQLLELPWTVLCKCVGMEVKARGADFRIVFRPPILVEYDLRSPVPRNTSFQSSKVGRVSRNIRGETSPSLRE
jgi:hypothetical protein